MKLDEKYKWWSRWIKIKLEQNQDDINELESAINIKKSTKLTIEKWWLNFDRAHPSFQRSYNNYLEAKKRWIRVQEHFDYIPTLKRTRKLDLSLPEIVLSETSMVKPEEPFLLESVAFEKTLSDYIWKNVHKKLISWYWKLENNPDALQKLDSYYTKFQEETYQNFKDINPSFDKKCICKNIYIIICNMDGIC